MSFQQGLSGLNSSAKNLDAIGNNVANASTVGFKQSQAQFADQYAASMAGASPLQVGSGGRVAAVMQQFSQGNITATNNSLDIAISGPGFFLVKDQNLNPYYTRNGQFHEDLSGFLVNNMGHNLQGYTATPATPLVAAQLTTTIGPLKIDKTDAPPKPTSTAAIKVNLDASAVIGGTGGAESTSITVYDSTGAPHMATLTFTKQVVPGGAPAGTVSSWLATLKVDNVANALAPAPADLNFDINGTLTTAVPTFTSTVVGAVGAIPFNLTGSTQYSGSFSINSLAQNGYSKGTLSGYSTGSDGLITGRYTNGQTQPLGRMLLSSFPNQQGLQPVGNNEWVSTATAGPVTGPLQPGTSGLGVLQSSAVEESNVDLTAELVAMIVAQRMYQANAQTIKAQDQILQTVVNLR